MPILQKTWTQPHNSLAIPTLPDSRTSMGTLGVPALALAVKDGLKNAATPWTVLASSNGSVADTNDNWDSPSDVQRGSNDTWPRSWVLLRSPSTPTIYMLIYYTSTSDYILRIRWSESQPDISSLSIFRLPEATGPVIDEDWYISQPGSGSYEFYVTMLTATDGSFMVVTATVGTNAYNVLMLNFLRGTHPNDTHPYVILQKNTSNWGAFLTPNHVNFNQAFSFAPDGTPLTCSLEFPAIMYGPYAYTLPTRAADDPFRNWKAFSWPIRVITTTSGYLGFKGYVEDFWWAGAESPTWSNVRWMQPGFEGSDMVVMKHGCMWFPCVEPFRW